MKSPESSPANCRSWNRRWSGLCSRPGLLAGGIAASLTLGIFNLSADTEEALEKVLGVPAGGTLEVEVGFGAVEVTTHTAPEVKVNAWRRVKRANKAEEEEYLRDRPIVIESHGSTVLVRAVSTRELERRPSKGPQENRARYTITVPSRFNVQLKTGAGPIAVRELEGDIKASSVGGELTFANAKGPIVGKTGGGRIRVENCDGNLRVTSSGGGIEVIDGRGSLNGETGGGVVKVKGFQGAASVKTGGGTIDLDDVSGPIAGTTGGGAISAKLPALANDVKLSTGGGGVTLRAPENAAFELDASTTAGTVASDFPVATAGKTSRQHLRGTVNGGGKTVSLKTGGGGVQIKRL